MALDLALIGSDGAPEASVPVSVQLHVRLIDHATALGLRELMRIRDYYVDVEFSPGDVQRLRVELRLAREALAAGDELSPLLAQVADLAARAQRGGRGLTAIAD